MKSHLLPGLAATVLLVLGACGRAPDPPPAPPPAAGAPAAAPVRPAEAPRNIVLYIGDGMGFAQVKAYRLFEDDPATPAIEALAFDPHLVGAVATEALPKICRGSGLLRECEAVPYAVTDSAASATAFATGRDTLVGAIAVDQDGQPLTTVLEAAKARGKATGMVVTSQLTHATPAAFAAHVPSRSQYAEIADQYLDNRVGGEPVVDVLLGGGTADFQRDDRDLVAEFVAQGYEYATDSEELEGLRGDRILGLFAPRGLPRAWDRPEDVPSLATMTAKALEVLSRAPEGYVLLVEGSQIDWAGHGRDIVGTVSEMEDFAAAIGVGLAFAREHGDTLVLITADHETGGLSIGRDGVYRWNPEVLRSLDRTPSALTEDYLTGERSLSEVVADAAPFELTAAERAALDEVGRDEEAVYEAINVLFAERSYSGWTTGGHTAVDVPLYAYGPGSERFGGVLANEVLGKMIMELVARP